MKGIGGVLLATMLHFRFSGNTFGFLFLGMDEMW